MSIKLMDNVVCNELPVIFQLFYGLIFYSVYRPIYIHYHLYLYPFHVYKMAEKTSSEYTAKAYAF